MSTARHGRLTPLAAIDEAGRQRYVLPFRRAGRANEPNQRLLGVPGSGGQAMDAMEPLLAEIRRLEVEIEAVSARLASCDGKMERWQVEADLGALALAAQHEVAAMEQAHEEDARRIREAAHAEGRRLIDAARVQGRAMRESAAELARLLTQPPVPGLLELQPRERS